MWDNEESFSSTDDGGESSPELLHCLPESLAYVSGSN